MTVTKYNANGNDFIIFHAPHKEDRSDLARKLCHRHAGVGADGMVVLVPHPQYDFEWEFYNSDGSYAAMCGNATRAAAHYAHEKGISKDDKAEFLTGAGVICAAVNGLYVLSDMIPPKIVGRHIEEFGKNWWLIDTGVPHLVALCEEIEHFDIEQARELRYRYNANVNIAMVKEGDIYLRTYERGVEDETLACGTGMVAGFVRAHEEGLVGRRVRLFPRSGDELDVRLEHGIYRFGGKVVKTFIAETLI
jgi:diaminopimelate epimerase